MTKRRVKTHKYLLCIFLFLFCFILTQYIFADTKQVHVISIKDYTINPVTADYIIQSINFARQAGAECIIIELDTPGGLISSTRSIVKKIMASEIPVIVYISPSGSRAGSAGVFITYASHIAAMAPSTNIGAAHPVQMGGQKRDGSLAEALKKFAESFSRKKEQEPVGDEKPGQKQETQESHDVMGDKILNDTVAFIKAIAEQRGRNAEWAEKSVRLSHSITEEQALENNVIDIIAKNQNDLLNQLDGKIVKIKDQEKILNVKDAAVKYKDMNFRQRLLNVLANPNIAYILLILGFYGLLFEVTHPGIGFPGIAGTISIILAFFSMQILPTNYAGLALIILGIILFIAEARIPGIGLLTLGGIVCMFLGSVLLFESSYQIMRVSFALILGFTGGTALITIVLVRAVFKAHTKKVLSGREGLIGLTGQAETDIKPGAEGKVFVHGELWNAVSDQQIKKGQKIKVVKIDGMLLSVRCV